MWKSYQLRQTRLLEDLKVELKRNNIIVNMINIFSPGSYIDSKTVDFSEKLRNERKQGYTIVWTGEPKKEEETPLKKYKRLNCEGL